MLQKKNWLRASSEDGLRIDSQGVVYRQDADGLVVQEVDDYSPLKKRSGWSVDRYLIEAGTVRIEAKAFLNCDSMKCVVIPDSVKVIGESAFCSCNLLEEVVIPESVEEICDFSFSGCISLRKVTIPHSVRIIGENVFDGCEELTDVCFQPNSCLEYFPDGLFQNCNKLQSITIPDSVSYISKYAFAYTNSLRVVYLPDQIDFKSPEAYKSHNTFRLVVAMGWDFELLQHSINSLERIYIPAAKRNMLEEHLPHLKHLFVDK